MDIYNFHSYKFLNSILFKYGKSLVGSSTAEVFYVYYFMHLI
jgi:hypothetical protein